MRAILSTGPDLSRLVEDTIAHIDISSPHRISVKQFLASASDGGIIRASIKPLLIGRNTIETHIPLYSYTGFISDFAITVDERSVSEDRVHLMTSARDITIQEFPSEQLSPVNGSFIFSPDCVYGIVAQNVPFYFWYTR